MLNRKNLITLITTIALSFLANTAHAKAYKGAELYSNQSYKYGRYEMRMRVANASGVLSTFFTYKNGSEVSGTFWEEIDIEVFGKNNATQLQTNIILGSPRITTEQVYTADASLADAYHTYVLEWTPDYVAWFLDGTEIRRITGTSTVTSLTNSETMRFNLWSSTADSWVGTFDDTKLPVYQFINYIDYKTYNATTHEFEGGFHEDFNSFDSSRWGKANWTFTENRVDFAPENIVIKDGILVLALTKEDATGFTGDVPADNSSSSSSSTETSSIAASSSSSTEASSVASSVEASSVAASSVASSSGGKKSSSGGGIDWYLLLLLSGVFIRKRH